ncbi:TPA: DUF2511 domain-containing protein [Serratia marcescens]|nr:DUF2511 domain-containing protein [Serratia marcescens]HEJ9038116.1 DUF2511 domain-containing protein [Serratia marcescens]HEJ9091277.1 DUF2511 domain-containing protein [Serratia marcescens]
MKKILTTTLLAALFFPPVSFAKPPQVIEKSEYKGQWPFSFKEGALQCIKGGAFVLDYDSGKMYALTGLARSIASRVGALPLEPDSEVWLEDPNDPGSKISLSDMTSKALALCDE